MFMVLTVMSLSGLLDIRLEPDPAILGVVYFSFSTSFFKFYSFDFLLCVLL